MKNNKKMKKFFCLPNIILALVVIVIYSIELTVGYRVLEEKPIVIVQIIVAVVLAVGLRHFTKKYFIAQTQSRMPKITKPGIYMVDRWMGALGGSYNVDNPDPQFDDSVIHAGLAWVARVTKFDKDGKPIIKEDDYLLYQVYLQGKERKEYTLYETTDRTFTYYRPDPVSYELKVYVPKPKKELITPAT